MGTGAPGLHVGEGGQQEGPPLPPLGGGGGCEYIANE